VGDDLHPPHLQTSFRSPKGDPEKIGDRRLRRTAQHDDGRTHTDRTLYRQRHRIENMFGRLKDWRRIHTRYDRCAHTFMSAIRIAAAVIF